MQSEIRNAHFDRLVNTKGLKWLGQNTNHHPVHPDVRDAMVACLDQEEFHAYAPPLGLEELRRLIVEDIGVPGMSAIVTDGAVSGLYHLCSTICRPGTRFVTTDPTWAWPMRFAARAGSEVVQIPIYGEEYGYRLAPERLAEVMGPDVAAIYIVDPNNPIGTTCTEDEIRGIAEMAREAGAYLIHDCTYRDFAYEHHLAARYYPERTITVWSFSKWLGLAGLRVGALIAESGMIDRLADAPPNNLGSSVLAQRGAIAGLKIKKEWFPGVLAEQRHNQALVKAACERIEGLHLPVYPSNGNFLVIECQKAGIRPEALCAAMARHGIMIRQGQYHTKQFGDRFVKVSVSVPTNWVEEFCRLLPQAVEEARGMNQDIVLF